MPRLALLISGCSVFLVLSWALVAILQANEAQPPHAAPAPALRAGDRGSLDHIVEAKEKSAKLSARVKLPGRDGPRGEFDKRGGERDRGGGPMSPAKKKKLGMRGITVDRKNIIETVEMEDLRAPPGRLWIPAALSGPVNTNSPDGPLFNVLVAYCQLDMVAYHESPWLFAMGAFHQRTSGCLDDPSLTRTYRLSSLKVSLGTAIVRCG